MSNITYWRQPPHQEPLIAGAREAHSKAVGQIHSWCRICRGDGVIMEGPNVVDCPDVALHRLIQRLDTPPDLMTKTQAAAFVGIDIRSINRHMAAGRLPYQLVGGRAILERRHVLIFKLTYWY